MDIVHERAAGMDISKRDAKVCIRIPGTRAGTFSKTVTTYGATTNEIVRLRRDLEEAAVTVVVMEATGDYWKPFYFLLAESLNVELVNAKAARNLPGRKTDVSDATWLAELAAHNLLRASFVPPEPIRQLRDLTRTRSNLTHERTRDPVRTAAGPHLQPHQVAHRRRLRAPVVRPRRVPRARAQSRVAAGVRVLTDSLADIATAATGQAHGGCSTAPSALPPPRRRSGRPSTARVRSPSPGQR